MKKSIKLMFIVIVIFLALWIPMGTIDFFRIKSFEIPVFVIPIITADDGGSGLYYGFGYSFKIKGNFMPEDELPGVTHYKYYLFGNLVSEKIRD